MYQKPLQSRARVTEQRFLDALRELLQEKSLAQLTIDDIALRANLNRSAFMKRFGTKKQALFILYEQYCDRVLAVMDQITRDLPKYAQAADVCYEMSKQAEQQQQIDFAANRAMHEIFQEKLTVDPRTKAIFLRCVDLMREIQKMHMDGTHASDVGAFAATQLLVTINYNYVLKAMPGLPMNSETRHQLISQLVVQALKT